MNDAELSLAVAKIMWPEYEWHGANVKAYPCTKGAFRFSGKVPFADIEFYHTTDDALGKMCVWLAQHENGGSDADESSICLRDINPHRAIAEAIVEVADA